MTVEQSWVNQAIISIKQSEYLLKGGFYQGSCFFSQQAVEQALKAKLVRLGVNPPTKHSLYYLYDCCCRIDRNMPFIDTQIFRDLNAVYKGTRYSNLMGALPFGNPTKRKANKLLTNAKDIVNTLIGGI